MISSIFTSDFLDLILTAFYTESNMHLQPLPRRMRKDKGNRYERKYCHDPTDGRF